MILQSTLLLSLVTVGLSTPIVLRSDGINGPPENSTFIPCTEGTTDRICQLIRQPNRDIITEILHPNGTREAKRNLYTREQLHEIRKRNKVTSIEYQPGEVIHDRSAEFISNLTKRDRPPPPCWFETQRWYDTHEWGYWYQGWHQVGSCFYCDECKEAIAWSFAVAQTWTVGLNVKFSEAIQASFGFSWGQTFTLTDTRTCQWKFVESGCHSIWYQPLMSYHNGYANYQTHYQCSSGAGSPGGDSYYDHHWAFANVNQGGNNEVNQGNLGCNSGCQGDDHRQCPNGNYGGVLWGHAN